MGDLQLNTGEQAVYTSHFFFQIDLKFCQVTIMNKLVVLATVCLIGAHGEPDPQEYEREVNSLNSLQQQPKPSFMDRIYGGAQGFANPYMRNNYGQPHQPTYGNLNPYPYYPQMPQMPPSWGYPSVPGGSSGYYPNYPSYPESSTSKPNHGETEY